MVHAMRYYQSKITLAAGIIFLFLGCTFTQRYQPGFNSKKAATLDSIKGKYGFEDITFLAKKTSKSGGESTSLTIKFINGKTVPADTAAMDSLGKLLGSKVKSIVKNPKEFETYIILFDHVVVKGAVTNEDYRGHEYKSDDL